MTSERFTNVWFEIEANMEFSKSNPERKAFWLHMQKVVRALHDIERVDSGEFPKSTEVNSILDCIYDFQAQDIVETT